MPDVVISHLNALAAKDKKTISADPVSLYYGLVIPDDAPYYDDTLFFLYPQKPQRLEMISRSILVMITILRIVGVNMRK